MAHIPDDIIKDILTRLPFTSVIRFRLVCKTWRDIIDHFQFQSDPTLIFLPHFDWDALYILQLGQNTTTIINFTCPVHQNKYHSLYANGLCCFYPDYYCLAYCSPYSYNLVTQESIKLPDLNISLAEEYLEVPGFGYDCYNQAHKLVLFNYGMANVLTLGSTSWRTLENVPNVESLTKKPPTVNGSLHWMTTAGSIVSFDLSSENFEFIAYPQLLQTAIHDCQVVNLGGCLSIANMSPKEHIELWIMKLYNLNDSWTKLIINRSYADHIRAFRPGCVPYHVLPICIWRLRKILLLYGHNTLVSYDIETAEYTPLQVNGISRYKISEQRRGNRQGKISLRYEVYGM